ncbi:MAG: hypothetical protein IKX09_00295 [Oscillospiraceae bacterium]|nr:hypothetical protein [Oscillospiraceae bacterium]
MIFTIMFSILMIMIFGRLLFFALRLAWGFGKVVFSLIFLPLTLLGIFLKGLIAVALPALIIIGIISLLTVPSRA